MGDPILQCGGRFDPVLSLSSCVYEGSDMPVFVIYSPAAALPVLGGGVLPAPGSSRTAGSR